jgi:hypothetical protein
MVDSLTVLDVTGRQLLLALENGVSRCDESEGRWPCDSVSVAGAPLEPDRPYSLVTKAYVAEGRDGYDVFRHVRVLADEEQCQNLPTIRDWLLFSSAASAGEHEHSAALSKALPTTTEKRRVLEWELSSSQNKDARKTAQARCKHDVRTVQASKYGKASRT